MNIYILETCIFNRPRWLCCCYGRCCFIFVVGISSQYDSTANHLEYSVCLYFMKKKKKTYYYDFLSLLQYGVHSNTTDSHISFTYVFSLMAMIFFFCCCSFPICMHSRTHSLFYVVARYSAIAALDLIQRTNANMKWKYLVHSRK